MAAPRVAVRAKRNGKANKFAEICAGVVLAGEMSLGSAILSGDWVSSHDQLGRNRP
jgi:hydroxymethylglutaryl-CoA reductase (NADPH)